MEEKDKKIREHPLMRFGFIFIFIIWILFLFIIYADKAYPATQKPQERFITQVQMCAKFHGNYEHTPKYIPEEIVLAQAIVESGWGTSRFAKEGNALFGMRTWNLTLPHLKPLGNPNAKFGVKKYNSWCHSVEDYLDTINTSQHYSEFRTLRDEGASTSALLDVLDKYSEDKNYTKKLLYIINEVL
jgi:uncharacterized FlgJ-related protein